METRAKVTQEVSVITDIICNKCGNSCRVLWEVFNFTDYIYASLEGSWGYGSKFDMENHKAHLCESCYKEIIKSFKIPVDIIEDIF